MLVVVLLIILVLGKVYKLHARPLSLLPLPPSLLLCLPCARVDSKLKRVRI